FDGAVWGGGEDVRGGEGGGKEPHQRVRPSRHHRQDLQGTELARRQGVHRARLLRDLVRGPLDPRRDPTDRAEALPRQGVLGPEATLRLLPQVLKSSPRAQGAGISIPSPRPRRPGSSKRSVSRSTSGTPAHSRVPLPWQRPALISRIFPPRTLSTTPSSLRARVMVNSRRAIGASPARMSIFG